MRTANLETSSRCSLPCVATRLALLCGSSMSLCVTPRGGGGGGGGRQHFQVRMHENHTYVPNTKVCG